MTILPTSNLELVDESAAEEEIKKVYETIKQGMQLPFVPNLFKASAISPIVLTGTWQVFNHVFLQSALPTALKAMILYSIAVANKCSYCSAVHQATCKSIGVDEATLKNLTENLSALEPRRVQAIISFAVTVATDGLNLKEKDYEDVREQGVTEEELTEIISLAALGNYLDTLADAYKIDVDETIKNALGG